ncbi:hypothetical protein OnM2_036085 [Erysiphe neolycopersici]|uniref:Uncharacterized protein n=1 Tax=Erysiphe neolycopersici TaxID=212602 RepID=A0A420HX15_9PEZI|nr:hypothetical protein OnM2_036085 [Erysiphe neolycopersici]
MQTADGNLTTLRTFAVFKLGVSGIWRTVYAYIRLKPRSSTDTISLILGLPWLLLSNIFENCIVIGDPVNHPKDETEAKKKLGPAYRGPCKVTAYGDCYKKSYKIRQLDGTLIRNNYHGDQLKPFRVREGYLVSKSEEEHPLYQNIRASKNVSQIPKR